MNLPLTISLLASNRIATLERCLDSLKPLLLQVPAELIVVFTGNDERVRQTAACYTDKIFPFSWCNDFSAARNEGLRHANGEWFLYLDDDEWFDDVTEICEFFRSGEYRHYGFAGYIQRNYLNQEGSGHTDAIVYRMAKRSPKLCFEGSIHEELRPYLPPCKVFRSYVHHYGYLKNQADITSSKASRNIPLLLEAIKKQPGYTKNYVQLTQEYHTQSNWEQAEEICRRGRTVCREEESRFRTWLQVVLVELLYTKKDYKQAEQEAIEILEKEAPCELARLLLFEFLLGIYEERQNFQKLLKYGIPFENLLVHMEHHPDLWITQQIGTINKDKVMRPDWLSPIRLNCARAALELKNPESAEFFLGLLPWEDEYQIQAFYPLLEQWKKNYTQLLHLLAKLPQDSAYLMFQRMLYEEKKQNQEAVHFLFCRCLKEMELPYLQKLLVEKAIRENKDFSILLKRMDLDAWKECIGDIINKTDCKEVPRLWEAQENLSKEYPLQGLWMEKLLREKILFYGFPMKKELFDTLEKYALSIISFYRKQFQESMFENNFRHLLPADFRMASAVLEALDNWRQGNLAQTIRLFRQIIGIYPEMTGVILEALRLLKNEIDHPAPAAGPEFEQLAVQMKAALETMLAGGQYAEAMSVLTQLLPLLPNDTDLIKLHQQLLSKIY
ncbi:MAG: glycosyltransferase [Lachnospiraceae bacterium]|nr:glycosyltransferase [Lachnospiraceae bacterium]MCI9305773.1 glycosyltransferase [Lachnospiraceae bacterium]